MNKTNLLTIDVFRHDEKATSQDDTVAELTEQGRLNAFQLGLKKQIHANFGKIIASPRQRALHSAILQFFATEIPDLYQYSLAQALDILKDHHHKISTDPRLNFHVESNQEFNDLFYHHYNQKEQNRTLDFQLHESDQIILKLANQTHPEDLQTVTGLHAIKGFKRMVGDLAEVIHEQVTSILSTLSQANPANQSPKPYHLALGTHSQNVECFLLRVMELQGGPEMLHQFLNSLPHHKSFIGYSEGFTMDCTSSNRSSFHPDQVKLSLNFQEFTWTLQLADLQILVNERNQFNHQVHLHIKAPLA